MHYYDLDKWSEEYFVIEEGLVKVNYGDKPALIDIINETRKEDQRGPVIIKFPHIAKSQIEKLFFQFNRSIKEYQYKSEFKAVFPLKVNQMPNFVLPLMESTQELNYGLEAGSKAELILATTYCNDNAPITVNGFKDKELIKLCFIVATLKNEGAPVTAVIEGLSELEAIVKIAKATDMKCPNIGLRIRLHTNSTGKWEKSGGINSKFGLNSTEILEAVSILKKAGLLDKLTMIHFHIGSSMNNIKPLKKALKESGHIYAQLINLGAKKLSNINIGGGLALNYSAYENEVVYSLREYANDVIFTLKTISKQKNVTEPNIFVESGRFVAAHSSVLVAPVLELFSTEYEIKNLKLKDENPNIINELHALYNDMTNEFALEYMHDALEHLESLLTLFDLGYIDLQDRSNAEVLTNLIIKKALLLKHDCDYAELERLQEKIQEKYLLNFSSFQGISDFWAIGQEFPILPLTHLDIKPTRSATLWDITCDSDGEIPFNQDKPLYLHDICLKDEEYFIGFFMVGAYQEILGMKHNLFAKPSEVSVEFGSNEEDEKNEKDKKDEAKHTHTLKEFIASLSILDILEDVGYDKENVRSILENKIKNLNIQDKKAFTEKLEYFLNDNNYLKTTRND
jgi:arginine decarboxylase